MVRTKYPLTLKSGYLKKIVVRRQEISGYKVSKHRTCHIWCPLFLYLYSRPLAWLVRLFGLSLHVIFTHGKIPSVILNSCYDSLRGDLGGYFQAQHLSGRNCNVLPISRPALIPLVSLGSWVFEVCNTVVYF